MKLDPNKKYRSQKLKIEVETPQDVKFSQKKIEHMKKLAQLLSQKVLLSKCSPVKSKEGTDQVAKTAISEKCLFLENGDYQQSCGSSELVSEETLNEGQSSHENTVDKDECNNEILDINSADAVQEDSSNTVKKTDNNDSTVSQNVVNKLTEDISNGYNTSVCDNLNSSCGSSVMNRSNEIVVTEYQEGKRLREFLKHKESHHKKKKHKRDKKKRMKKIKKDAKFEGERVPHLVKCRNYAHKMDDEEEEQTNIATQDEYVLKKLFDKSGKYSM